MEAKNEEKEKALQLQASEYERRLQTLNHEYARIAEVLAKSVSQERFEEYVKSEREREVERSKTDKMANDLAFANINQRFGEVDKVLAGQKAVVEAQAKTFNRNIAIATVVLAVVVVVISLVGV